MLAALSTGLTFSHLLQLPPRMSFDGPTWITTQRVCPLYGTIGAFIEIGAVLLAGVLAYTVRGRPAFGWTLAGAVCLTAALAVWLGFVAPANAHIAQMALDAMPEDWTRWRLQWEYAHATRAVFLIVGFGLLVQSVLVERGAPQST